MTNSYKSFQNAYVIETGLSDFHKMIVTVMKIHFQKQKPEVINYCDYRNFSEKEYRQQILYELSLVGNVWREISFDSLLAKFKETLDKTAPIIQNYVRSNHSPFLNKENLKSIMNQTGLRNRFLKRRSMAEMPAYNRQKTFL